MLWIHQIQIFYSMKKASVCIVKLQKKILPYWKKINNPLNQTNKRKKKRANNKFNCIIGVSGGVDSSCLLHFVKKYDLKLHISCYRLEFPSSSRKY